MVPSTLRSLSLPRFALRRDEAAASLAISPASFDVWVANGIMPRGKKVRGVMLWDAERIRMAWLELVEADEPEPDSANPFDHMVV